MSLISEDRDRVGGRRSEIGDDFVVRQKSDKDDKGGVPSRGARKGLKDNAQRGLCLYGGWYSCSLNPM